MSLKKLKDQTACARCRKPNDRPPLKLCGKCAERQAAAYDKWRRANLEKRRIAQKAWAKANPEKVCAIGKKYRGENKEKLRAASRAWSEANSEKRRFYREAYRKANLENLCATSRAWYWANKEKAHAANKAWTKTSYASNQEYRLRVRLRSRLYDAVKKDRAAGSAVRDLGCSIPELKIYLESLWQPGMDWTNWTTDGWHIDHIRPLSAFDLTDRGQLLEACHYTNLQPMWARENLHKSGIRKRGGCALKSILEDQNHV